MMADYQKEMDIEKSREIKELKDFTAKKGAKVQEIGSGVLVEVTNAGDQTLIADSGKQVSILYRGTFLDGKKFDGNMDKDSQNNQPLVFVVNSGSVIRGMDEGMRLFGKGGRGKLYIPALLGYGPNGSAPVIPPYASLVFDIEVLDVTIPAPNATKPGAPQPAAAPERK
jgi:FKBP-type peptidyl-prolyl cis-trans isomerase